MIRGQYESVERGDLAAWARALAPEAVLFGTDPEETFVGRDVISARLTKAAASRMRPQVRRTYRSVSAPRISLAPDRKAGWVYDEIEYVLSEGESTKTIRFRMTGVLAEREEGWKIVAAAYSMPMPDADAFSRTLPAPDPLPDAIAADAEPIARIARSLDEDPRGFAGLFSGGRDVLLIGTSAEEHIQGGPEVRRFTRQDRRDASRIRVRRTGGAAGGLASPSLGWLAYTAILAVQTEDRTIDLPVRVLAVFLDEAGTWWKVQEHVSVPTVP